MFRRFSLLTCIAAVALIVAAAPAPATGQLLEGSAVIGYGFRSQKNFEHGSTSGPLVRVGARLRIAGFVALGGEIGHNWLGETRFSRPEYNLYNVDRDRIRTYTFCIEVGKLRSRISPRVMLGAGISSVHTKSVTKYDDGSTYTSASSETWLAPQAGLVIVKKTVGAKLGLRAEVRTALMLQLEDDSYLLNSLSLGVAF